MRWMKANGYKCYSCIHPPLFALHCALSLSYSISAHPLTLLRLFCPRTNPCIANTYVYGSWPFCYTWFVTFLWSGSSPFVFTLSVVVHFIAPSFFLPLLTGIAVRSKYKLGRWLSLPNIYVTESNALLTTNTISNFVLVASVMGNRFKGIGNFRETFHPQSGSGSS